MPKPDRPTPTLESMRGKKREDLTPEEKAVLSVAAERVLATRLGFWPKGKPK